MLLISNIRLIFKLLKSWFLFGVNEVKEAKINKTNMYKKEGKEKGTLFN